MNQNEQPFQAYGKFIDLIRNEDDRGTNALRCGIRMGMTRIDSVKQAAEPERHLKGRTTAHDTWARAARITPR